MSTESPADDPLALSWLDTVDLHGLAGWFDSFARMEGVNSGSVSQWGGWARDAVGAELAARRGGQPPTTSLPPVTALTDTELVFIAASSNGVRLAGGDGLRQWIERMADHITAELADRALRRGWAL
jgi:hypothetical protein